MIGLSQKTQAVFEKVSAMDCIKPYILVGGTALSLQIKHRNSEDLDFQRWRKTKKENCEIDISSIKKELSLIAPVKTDILDFNHVLFNLSGVKLSFYYSDYRSPAINPIKFRNNLALADKDSIFTMKLDMLLKRNAFRDYYDVFSLLKEGTNLKEGLYNAVKYANHEYKIKTLLEALTNSNRFIMEKEFNSLEPKYNVSSKDIALYISDEIKRIETLFFYKELPIEEFALLGLDVNSISNENMNKLLNGEKTDVMHCEYKNSNSVSMFFDGRLSLQRNPDNSVSLICSEHTQGIKENNPFKIKR